jgi:hypothetical protein
MIIKIDVVIPTYIGDFYNIKNCVENLLLQTILPNHIIIAISEINKELKIMLEMELNKLEQTETKIIILDIIEKKNGAQNRNRGIAYAKENTKPDYIMFVNCDDITHINKIEYFLYSLSILSDVSMFLHNYVSGNIDFDIYEEYDIDNDDNIILPCIAHRHGVISQPFSYIHYGHVIVKAEICYDVQYNEQMIKYNDSEFCKRVCQKYGNVYTFTKPLLKYII